MNTPSAGLLDDERLVVSPRRASRMLDCGNTRLYELLKARELESFLDGRSRKITVSSIKAYIARRLRGAELTSVISSPEAASGSNTPQNKFPEKPSKSRVLGGETV